MNSQNFKNIEDIEKDVNNIIKEISCDEDNLQNQVKDIIAKIDSDFETIQQKEVAFNSISQSLQNKYNKYLRDAAMALEQCKSLFSDDVHLFKNTFKRSLVILFISLIVLLFCYNFLLYHISWLNNAIYGIPVISLLIFSLVFVLLINAYMKTNSKINSDLETLERTIKYLNDPKIVCNPTTQSTLNFEKTETIIQNLKNIVGSLLFNIGKVVPIINQTYEEFNLLIKYKQLVESFESSMSYYRLLDDHDYFYNISKIAPIDAHILSGEEEWKVIISNNIAVILKLKNINVSENLILLLYKEHNGLATRHLFRCIRDEKMELENFASIIINSQRLVMPLSGVKYNRKDIVALLRKLDDFSLSEVNTLLTKSFRLLDYLESYVEFLHKNGIHSEFQPTIEFLITESDDMNSPFEKQIIDLSYKAGTKIFSEIEDLEEVLIDGFTRASISLKFHDDISLREIACKCSGEDASTAIIRAYYEKYNERDRQKIVSIDELLANLQLIAHYLENIDDNELQFLKSQLKEGNWYDSSVAYIADLLKKSNDSVKTEIAKLGDLAILKESVTEVFTKVNIGTIEKAIDSQIFSAYIIMSDSSEGNLADIIDELSIRNSKATSEEKKWEEKSEYQKKLIENKYGINLKYDFVQFSNSTRIGILPRGQSFYEFQQVFLEDIKKVLRCKNKKFKIGLVIQRITPSKYSFGILDDSELSTNVTMKNLDVARYIAKLASDYVSLEEKVSVMKFEKDIDLLEIVNHKSIYEIIRRGKDDIENKEKQILESPMLKKDILIEVNNILGIKDFKTLTMSLHLKHISKDELNDIVSNILRNKLSSEPSLKKNARIRAIRLAERFSDALEKLACIYELQNS